MVGDAGAVTGKSFTAPSNVVATPGNTENTITFDSVAGATGYNLYWHTSASFSIATAVLNGRQVSGVSSGYSHTGRINGTAYYYVVTAYDATVESVASAETSAIPSGAVTPSSITPDISLTFDATAGLWGQWNTSIAGLSEFPLMDWTIRTGVQPRSGEGIMYNGDLVTVNDDLSPNDTLLASTYVDSGYVDTGYITESSGAGIAIPLTIRAGQYDGGTDKYKFAHNARVVCDNTLNAQDITIKWSDERSDGMNTGKTLDLSKDRKVRRMGKFRRRNHQLEYSGEDVVRLEALEIEITAGSK